MWLKISACLNLSPTGVCSLSPRFKRITSPWFYTFTFKIFGYASLRASIRTANYQEILVSVSAGSSYSTQQATGPQAVGCSYSCGLRAHKMVHGCMVQNGQSAVYSLRLTSTVVSKEVRLVKSWPTKYNGMWRVRLLRSTLSQTPF